MPSLPQEIWMLVYILCPDIQTAVRLAATNKNLREIWLKKHTHIASTILKPDIPAYDDAVRVAKLETGSQSLRSATATDSAATAKDLEPQATQCNAHLWIPCLLKTAQLALVVTVEWEEWITDLTRVNFYREDVDLTSPTIPTGHEAYYFMREFVTSYSMTELRPALISKLNTCPMDALHTYNAFCVFMYRWLSREMKVAHQVLRNTPIREWSFQDTEEERYMQPPWDYASDIIEDVWHTRRMEVIFGKGGNCT